MSEPTMSDIYYKLGTLEGLLASNNNAWIITTERLDLHEKRIRHNESALSRLSGIFLIATPAVAFIVAIATRFVGGLFK